ncbi:Glycopeptide antibiotics resistance protein [Lachnospiraceae bacterium XBB1006]|nr:Glycopeptide antibiotics resistance protein [Lachnospiraceae bacterium XBB1006]
MERRDVHVQRKIAEVCFCLYLIVLIYYLLFAERDYLAKGYNVIPFAEITRYIRYHASLGARLVVVNLGGNVIGFLPFGYLLPQMSSRFRRGMFVGGCCFLFSFCVEAMQLVLKVGCFDVDDILMNTVGSMLGYGLYLGVNAIRRKKNASKKEET